MVMRSNAVPARLWFVFGLSVILVFILTYWVRSSQPVSSEPEFIPTDIPPFEARLVFDQLGERNSGSLAWSDRRNWRLEVFDSTGTLAQAQTVTDGSLTIELAEYGARTEFPEKLDRAPGGWFVTAATAAGRGGVREGIDPVFVQTLERPCANDPALADICDGRATITEVTEYEFDPDTGIIVRYSVALDGETVNEIRLTDIDLVK